MKNLFKKAVFILLISFLGIFLIGFLVNWQTKKIQESFSRIGPPKFELPKKIESSKEIKEWKEFRSRDGKLKFEYPGDWIEIESQRFEETLPEETKGKLEPLFFAQKMKMEELTFATLAVEELIFEKEITPEKIIKEIEKYYQQTKEIKILKLEQENSEIIFEGRQVGIFGFDIFLKGKFLPTKEKVYLVIFTIFSKGWPKFQEEIEQILKSVELLD